ncbi:MAG: cyclopropane-fatty-acyl-phospholipid synthase family protein [Sphingobium sp.]
MGRLLSAVVKHGSLTMLDYKGRASHFGDGSAGPNVVMRMTKRSLPLRILLNPALAAGEAYMDGTLRVEKGTIRDFFTLFREGGNDLYMHPLNRLRRAAGRWIGQPANNLTRSLRNVQHHYDLSDDLYALFLDDDWQYSCAYFGQPDQPLEDAQAAKKRHLAAKLLLSQGLSVLDIGSGWGGLALDLARHDRVNVTGVTLSKEQFARASRRAEDANLSSKVAFHLQDYRHVAETFDRIISVGMFEHVGVKNYPEFFRTVERLLKPDGVAVIHSIGRMGPPEETDAWTQKYIFPGGYVPSMSEVLPAIELTNLWITDVEILRLHYAETLRNWYERFSQNREKAVALKGERFCRMWEYYLAACEMSFRTGRLMVFQIQLAKKRDTVPLTRQKSPI